MNTLERILMLLDKAGISDQEFIKIVGAKDKNLILNWRNGVTKSYTKYIDKIAENFNVSTDYLLSITDDPTPPNVKKEPTPEIGSFEWLRKGLVARGVIKEGEDLTDEQLSIAFANLENLVKVLGSQVKK